MSYNKLNYNSSNISKISTRLNQSESYLFSTLIENNKTINFQKENKKLKNKFFNVLSRNIDKYSYKNLFLQKKINNSRSITNINPFKLKSINKTNFLSKSKSEINIKNISFISQKIEDHILERNKKSVSNFKRKIKAIILLKKYLYEQKLIYQKEYENNQNNILLIKKINKKIKDLNYLIKENENILEFNRYIKFLIEKRIELKYSNLLLSTQIDYLKDDNKELFIRIKEKSEKLWELFNIRNLLICVKERIFIKDLPLIFHCHNTSYLSTLIKQYNNYVDLLESRKKYILNNPLINFKIPTNLVEYIYSSIKNEINRETLDKKMLNYLNPKIPIFKNEDEFIRTLSSIEEQTIDSYFFFFLYQKGKNDEITQKYINTINTIKNENKYINETIEKYEIILIKLKQKNKYYNTYINQLKKEYNIDYNIDKNRDILKNEKINAKNEDIKNRNINNKFLRSITNTISPEKNKFYFYLNNLKNEKKFRMKNSYMYYMISKNTLELYKKIPKYFYIQNIFSFEYFNKCINNINNLENNPLILIIDNVIYLLSLYNSAITLFLIHYKKIIKTNNKIFNSISNQINFNKKLNFVEFRKILDDKINKLKIEKLLEKNNKIIIKQIKPVLPMIKYFNNKSKTDRKKIFNLKKNINPYSSLIIY